MALKADNRDLPKAPEGNPPDTEPRYGHLLAQAWWDIARERDGDHQRSRTDTERYIRLGWGGKCARELGYKLLGVPESDPPDLAAEWRMGLGTLVHEQLQSAMVKVFPDASVEHKVGVEHDEVFGFPVSGRTDVFLIEDKIISDALPDGLSAQHPKRTAIEVKTLNGFAFKKAIGARGAAEGPRSGALFQAALNGRALGADEVVVVVLSMECLSDRELVSLVKNAGGEEVPARKFVAEWTFAMADLDEMVDREVRRLAKIMAMVDNRAAALEEIERQTEGGPSAVLDLAPLPPRSIPLEMPAKARVIDPTTGKWQTEVDGNVYDAGTTWFCGYCGMRTKCIEDGPS